MVSPEELISITETDLWKRQQKSLITDTDSVFEFQVISITDTDFGSETNLFCNQFGYNGIASIL